jgi:hypothetical protein
MQSVPCGSHVIDSASFIRVRLANSNSVHPTRSRAALCKSLPFVQRFTRQPRFKNSHQNFFCITIIGLTDSNIIVKMP